MSSYAVGASPRANAGVAAAAAVVVALVLSAVLGLAMAAVHAVALASAWAYNAGLKKSAWSIAPFIVSFGLFPSLATLAADPPRLATPGATLGGAALGGWLAYTYGRRHALLVGGVTQTLSLGLYLVASIGVGGFSLVVTASLAEHILGGAATVAVFTLMMDACQQGYEGSDYALFACAVVGVQGAAGFAAGIVGDLFQGYDAATLELLGTADAVRGVLYLGSSGTVQRRLTCPGRLACPAGRDRRFRATVPGHERAGAARPAA